MEIKLLKKGLVECWEDDVPNNTNILSITWTGYQVNIILTNSEQKDSNILKAVNEYPKRVDLSYTRIKIKKEIKNRITHLNWCDAWSQYYNQPQNWGWYISTDYTSEDQPAICCDDKLICLLPNNIKPGDFEAVKTIILEQEIKS